MTTAEIKAFNLHKALTGLLERYRHLIKDTNSEPLSGEDEGVTLAEAALYDNRPLADWDSALPPSEPTEGQIEAAARAIWDVYYGTPEIFDRCVARGWGDTGETTFMFEHVFKAARAAFGAMPLQEDATLPVHTVLLADINKAAHAPGTNASVRDVLQRAHRAIRKSAPAMVAEQQTEAK